MTAQLDYDELLERAAPFLRHLAGQHSQKSHGGGGTGPGPLRGQDALDAAPYQLEGRGPESSAGVSRERMDKALASYAGFGHGTTNFDLRHKGNGPVPPRSRKMVKEIDAAMASSRLSNDVEVIRELHGPHAFGETWKPKGKMTGTEFRDAGFSSTSANSWDNFRQVGGYDAKSGTVMHIRVPKGTHALSLSRPGDDTGEMEILLDRGLTYKVTGDRKINGKRHLDVEVVS